MKKIISIVISAAFIITSVKSPAYAQLSDDQMPRLPQPGVMVHLSPEFAPAQLQGITVHPDNALQFDFLIRKGDQALEGDQKKEEYKKLVKYFLASLTIPDEEQWVNLSPYENNRIIKDDFGKTEMGRDLLAEDYMLKQITSSLIYPEDGLGKKFWDKVYQRAWNEYHTTDVPVNTFNKVWIVPDQAIVYESGNTAFILQSHLKVMLEEDYLSLQKHSAVITSSSTHTIGSQVIREIILPELEREVNEGKNFAPLRQMYSGMILATWYKKALKESLLGKVYADKAKVKGVDQNPKTNEEIYRRYLKAFKKGVFNYIKDDVDKYTNEAIPRKYFSGGFQRTWTGRNGSEVKFIDRPDQVPANLAMVVFDSKNNLDRASIVIHAVGEKVDQAMYTDWYEELDKAHGYLLSHQWEVAELILVKASEQISPFNIILQRKLNYLNSLLKVGTYYLPNIHDWEYQLERAGQFIGAHDWVNAKKILDTARIDMPMYRVILRRKLVQLEESYDKEHDYLDNKPALAKDQAMASPLSLDIRKYRKSVIPLIEQLVVLNGGELKTNSYGIVTFEFNHMIDMETQRKLVSGVDEIFSLSNRQNSFITSAEFDGNKLVVKITWPPGIDEPLESIGLRDGIIKKISNLLAAKSLTIQDILDQYSWKDLFIAGEKRLYSKEASEVIRGLRANGLQLRGDPFPLGKDISGMKLEEIGRIFREQFGDSIPSVLNWSSGDISKLRDNFNITTLGNLIGRKWPVTVDILLKDKINWFSKTYLPRPNMAMLTNSGRVNKVQPEAFPGGIDFNSANLAMVIKRDGHGVPLPLAQQDMAQLSRIQGFDPEIIEIRPAMNVPIIGELRQKLQPSST